MAIGCGLGQETSAPAATELIIVKDVSIAYDVTYEALTNGTLTASEVETYGANKGVVYATDWMGSKADDEAKSRFQETLEKMTNGEIEISIQ